MSGELDLTGQEFYDEDDLEELNETNGLHLRDNE